MSHRLDEVFAIADRVTVVRDGRTVAVSAAAELDHRTLIELILGRAADPSHDGATVGPIVVHGGAVRPWARAVASFATSTSTSMPARSWG